MADPAWWRARNAELDPRYVSPVRIWTKEEIAATYTDEYITKLLADGHRVHQAAVYGWGIIIDYCTLTTRGRGRLYGAAKSN